MANADAAQIARIDAAFALVDPTGFAGAAEDVAETATRTLELARMYAGGARRQDVGTPQAHADFLRRLAEDVRTWGPSNLWRGLLQAANATRGGI